MFITRILRTVHGEHQREPPDKGEPMTGNALQQRSTMTRKTLHGALSVVFGMLLWGCTATSATGVHPETQVSPQHPPPTASERCQSDAALLSTYSIEQLYGTPLPSECCEPGVLPENREWLCEHDWPSSDVPACSHWQDLIGELHAFRSSPPSWVQDEHRRVAQGNMQTLMMWADSQSRCIPDQDPS